MHAIPLSKVIVVLSFLSWVAAPVLGQTRPEWRLGSGFLYTRDDGRLWGLNLQREQRLAGPLVGRGVASVDVLGDGFLDPLLVTMGADVGVRGRLSPLTGLVAIGPALAYFQAPRRIYTTCAGTICSTYQRGYEPGFVLAATGSAALGLQVSSELAVFSQLRMYVPSGLGRSGAADDPHAAFVELAFGVTLHP